MSRDLDRRPTQERADRIKKSESERQEFLDDLRKALRHGPTVRVLQAWLGDFGTVPAPTADLIQTGYNMGRASAGSTIRNDIGDACQRLNFALMLDQIQKGQLDV